MATPPPQMQFHERLGVTFIVLTGSISMVSVIGILLHAAYRGFAGGHRRRYDASDSLIFLNLMFADLIQALGVMPNIKWVNDGYITEGTLCTAQAIVKQIGINGVSFTSLALTIYTFVVLVFYTIPSIRTSVLTILAVWFCTALIVIVPNVVHSSRHETYYGNTGYWCWILARYGVERIVTEFAWVWLTGLTMLILYVVMFLVMSGWVVIDKGIHWYNRPTTSTQADQEAKEKARLLFFYPAVYIFCFLPNTISRWLTFTGHPPASSFVLFANAVFAFSGFFNFVVFYKTRRAMVVGEEVAIPGGDAAAVEMAVPTRRLLSAKGSGFLPGSTRPSWKLSDPPLMALPASDNQSSSMHAPSSHNTQPPGTSRSHQDDSGEDGPGFLPLAVDE